MGIIDTLRSRLFNRANRDAGFIFMGALLVFVLLSATTIVIVAAAQNQTSQTRASRINIQTRTNITLAESDALDQLNRAGYSDATSFTWRTAATARTGTNTDDGTSWNWFFDATTNTVNATAQAKGSTVAKRRAEQIELDYADVASYRYDANNLPIYSASALGTFKDAVSVSAEGGSTGSRVNTNGTFGMYGLSTYVSPNILTGTGGQVVVSHDDRNNTSSAVQSTMTQRRDAITSTIDERVSVQTAAANCPTDSWQPALISGSMTTDSTVQCYDGLNVSATDTLTVMGTGVKTIAVRGTTALANHTLAGNVSNPNGGQLHIIFAKGNSWDHPLVLGNGTAASNLSGLYAYAPKSECRTGSVVPVITGSLACSRLNSFNATVNWRAPMPAVMDGTSRRVWFTKR